MKKIPSTLKNQAEYVARPFALLGHEHTNYLPIDQESVVEIFTPVVFRGVVSGLDATKPAVHAGIAVSALRVLATDDDGFGYYADPLDSDSTRRILGMTIAAGNAGQLVSLLREGQHQDVSWNFDVTKRLFLGANGTITQVAPATGISVVLGHAQKPDTIFLNIEKPIILT